MRTVRKTGPEPITLRVNDDEELTIQRQARSDLYSTFRVGGPADYLARAGTTGQISIALAWARQNNQPVTVFGGGSNMLISDRGIRGLALIVRRPGKAVEKDLEMLDETSHEIHIRVPSAAPLSWLGKTASDRGWAGLTWAVGLPGNVGGATVNNAGAHGTEFKDHLAGLRIIDEAGTITEHDRSWLNPSYRRTELKAAGNPRHSVVTDVTLRLPVGDPEMLRNEANENADYRHLSQPTGACAGSIFQNPLDTYSGLIIEQLGLKGTRVGGAVVSEKHANFIVNDDGATAQDIVQLIELVQEHVRAETGIELKPEIERIGEW